MSPVHSDSFVTLPLAGAKKAIRYHLGQGDSPALFREVSHISELLFSPLSAHHEYRLVIVRRAKLIRQQSWKIKFMH
jgi:hypothetical protein